MFCLQFINRDTSGGEQLFQRGKKLVASPVTVPALGKHLIAIVKEEEQEFLRQVGYNLTIG